MTNALGTSPTGYARFSDANPTAWLMNAFQIAAGGTISKVRFYQPISNFATTVGVSTLTAHIWHSGNAAGQTFSIPLTNTLGFVEATLSTPVVATAGEWIGVEYQAPAGGHYVAKAGALPFTANGITVDHSSYRDASGTAAMTDAVNDPATATGTASYGLDIEVGVATLSALACTVVKTDSTHVSVSWPLPDATISGGVTILRGTGTLSTDATGKTPTDAGYDPTTIATVSVRATGQTTSPYSDTVPSAGTYTYWIARTAG